MRSFLPLLLAKYNYNVQVKEDEMGRACNIHGVKKNVCRILVGKPEGKRPVGRHKDKWEDNIKMNIIETEQDGMGWVDLAQDMDQCRALMNTVMNLGVP
jgi:hypothetical protein